jgi:hypothetical protein
MHRPAWSAVATARVGKEVAVLLAVQGRELVPEESDRGERGAEYGLADVLVLAAVDAELVLDGVVQSADTGNGLVQLIANAIRLVRSSVWVWAVWGRRKKFAPPRRTVASAVRMAVAVRTGHIWSKTKSIPRRFRNCPRVH